MCARSASGSLAAMRRAECSDQEYLVPEEYTSCDVIVVCEASVVEPALAG